MTPTRELELSLPGIVCGVDEVGKGSWAGPLVVCVAVLDPTVDVATLVARDSKSLSEKKREALFDVVATQCRAWALGAASNDECDQLGMNDAQRLAARRAFDALAGNGVRPDSAVVDGRWDFVSPLVRHVRLQVKADAVSASVAAASVLAKVTRDRIMRAEAEHYPHWAFDSNKGYPCLRHRAALQGYGPSAIHRRSWAFMDNYVPFDGVKVPAERFRQSP